MTSRRLPDLIGRCFDRLVGLLMYMFFSSIRASSLPTNQLGRARRSSSPMTAGHEDRVL
jgi:hypothetical protein